MSSISARYVPINHAHIPSFLNRIPNVDWQTYLPKFKNQKNDDASLHLVRFHMHVCKLGMELNEDSLMKMFMVSFEGNVWSWYERFASGSLYSLRYFHTVFHEHFKDKYPSLLLIQDCCTRDKGFNLKDIYGDDQYMDEEIL